MSFIRPSFEEPEDPFAGQMTSGPSRPPNRNVLHQKGRIKWFSLTKHFGFIISSNTDEEIFFHQSNLRDISYDRVIPNLPVCYLVRITPKGQEAYNIQPDEIHTSHMQRTNPTDYLSSGSQAFHWPPMQTPGPEARRQRNTERLKRSCRCYNCGQYASHKAAFCPLEPLRKCCYRCRSSTHLVANCPFTQQLLSEQFESMRFPPSHTTRPVSGVYSGYQDEQQDESIPSQSQSVLRKF